MTLLRASILACLLSAALSAGTVVQDSFALIDGNGTLFPLGSNSTGTTLQSINGTGACCSNQHYSFSIGTNLTGPDLAGDFTFNGPLEVWLNNFDFSCSFMCSGTTDIVASFTLNTSPFSMPPFNGFTASAAGGFTPTGNSSSLQLFSQLSGADGAFGSRTFSPPPYSFSLSAGGPVIANIGNMLTFTFGIINTGIRNISMPGRGFEIAATPEPGSLALLSGVMVLGLGARFWQRLRRR